VIETTLAGDDHGFMGDVRRRHVQLRERIRRSLAGLRPTALQRVYNSLDGEELDLDAAIEAIVDRRSGAPLDDRVQIRRDRIARDVATALLVDLSASTSAPVAEPEPAEPVDFDPEDDVLSYAPLWGDVEPVEPARRIIDVARDAVALLSDALDELGDRHAIYGFSGTGRANVEFHVAKAFADPVSAGSGAAIAAMRPRQYTRMGPAIRHASHKLQRQPSRTKLLLVISDGYPQDVDYGDDRRDKDYGIHDTARALADATEAGIDTFCVTIDPAGQDYLRRMCPDRRYVVIEDVEALPEELAKLYAALSPG
jgi:nitric oxide reductase activation protein